MAWPPNSTWVLLYLYLHGQELFKSRCTLGRTLRKRQAPPLVPGDETKIALDISSPRTSGYQAVAAAGITLLKCQRKGRTDASRGCSLPSIPPRTHRSLAPLLPPPAGPLGGGRRHQCTEDATAPAGHCHALPPASSRLSKFDRALFAPCDKHPVTVVLQHSSEQDLPFVIQTRSNWCQHTAMSHGRFRSGFLTPERGLMRLPVAPINLIPPEQCVAALAEVLCSPSLVRMRGDSATGLTEGTGTGRNSPGFQAASLTLFSLGGFPLRAAWFRSLFSTSGSFQTN